LDWTGLRVLEIGCGCAPLPSFQSLLNGASLVVSSDAVEDALQLAKKNFNIVQTVFSDHPALISAASRLHIVPYSFGSPLHSIVIPNSNSKPDSPVDSPTFDIILGSYILYDPDSFPLLADSLRQCFNRNSSAIALFTSHDSQRDQRFSALLKEMGVDMVEWWIDGQQSGDRSEDEKQSKSEKEKEKSSDLRKRGRIMKFSVSKKVDFNQSRE
jgi:predicted nicotinamide N-methyase